jgi:hypothetical protein
VKKIFFCLLFINFAQYALGQKSPNPMEEYQRENLRNDRLNKEPTIKEYGGLILGYQGLKNHLFEIGFGYGATAYDFIFVGMGPSAEVNIKEHVNGYKFGIWVNSLLSFGLSTMAYHNYNKESLFYNKVSWGLRPEIGIGAGSFCVTYGYNFLVNNTNIDGVNKNMISARFMLPVKRKK